jgi:hypothetical protein
MHAALRFRLAPALLMVAAIAAFNVFGTDRVLDQSPWFAAFAALVAAAVAHVLGRSGMRGGSAPGALRIRVLLVAAFALPLVLLALTVAPWALIAFNSMPRTVAATLLGSEPVKGCQRKVWLKLIEPGDEPMARALAKGLCLEAVDFDRSLRPGDAARLFGRDSWAGFVIDRVAR